MKIQIMGLLMKVGVKVERGYMDGVVALEMMGTGAQAIVLVEEGITLVGMGM